MKRTVIIIDEYPDWFTGDEDDINSMIKHYTSTLSSEYEIRFIFELFDIIVYKNVATKILKIL